jgi:hypothetical protein
MGQRFVDKSQLPKRTQMKRIGDLRTIDDVPADVLEHYGMDGICVIDLDGDGSTDIWMHPEDFYRLYKEVPV